MRIHIRLHIFVLVPLLWVLGCASQQPLSNYARTGDTVMVSLGGTDSNALVPVLWKENVTASITDAANNVYPVKVRNLFRVYSDPTSRYNYKSVEYSYTADFDDWVPSHMGLWMAVLDLVNPNTGQAPGLAAGPAMLSVSSPELQPWVDYAGWGWDWTNGNLSTIPLEILPGTGSANPLNYLDPLAFSPLDSLEPSPQIEIRARVPAEFNTIIGGGSFVFRYMTSDFGSAAWRRPRVTTTAADPNVQLASRHVDQSDGTTLLTVVIMNPHGFNPDDSKTELAKGRSLLRSLRFNILWRDSNKAINDTDWQSSLQFVSGQFVDLDGNPLSGVTPVLAKVR